jgi:periplasmic divalent cation tolerance protein
MSKALQLVYMTARHAAQARRLARVLVEERLAACVNILGPVTSVYRWQGKVEQAREVALLAKTRGTLVPRLQQRVRELHDYDVPCVVALSITGGNPDFLAWLETETAPVSSDGSPRRRRGRRAAS